MGSPLANLLPNAAAVEGLIRAAIPAQVPIFKRALEHLAAMEANELALHLADYPMAAAYLHGIGMTLDADEKTLAAASATP